MGFVNVEKITSVKKKRNTIKRWSEHDYLTNDFEPARHSNKHINHGFTWKILGHTSKMNYIPKNLEAIFMASLRPSLNEPKHFELLILGIV